MEINTLETYDFDSANLQLSGITTTGNSATIQDYDYWWDRAGNLARRDRPNVQEKFYYDPLNRLDYVTRTAGGVTTTTMDLSYDPNGNIVSKLAGGTGSDVGTYKYGTSGGGAHAVSNISGARGGTFHYDAAGNLDCNSWSGSACNSGSSIVWSSYNLPTRINHGGTANYADFAYGPNRERVRITEHEGSGTRAVYRVGEYFEIEVTWGMTGSPDGTRYRSLVYFGDRLVYARVDDSLEASALQQGYVHLDHLGSVDRVTSFDGGGAVISYSFDAFGKRRNPADWSNDDADARFADTQWTERGFTGHEQLDVVRLIHMKGRVQNPIWGRMLSPDPMVADLSRPQELNAYSYVANRPVTFTDPTGFKSAAGFPGFDGVGGPVGAGENAQVMDVVEVTGKRREEPDPCATSICGAEAIAAFTDNLLSMPVFNDSITSFKEQSQLRLIQALNKAAKSVIAGKPIDSKSANILLAAAGATGSSNPDVNDLFKAHVIEHTGAAIVFGAMIVLGPMPVKIVGVIGEVGLLTYAGYEAYKSYNESLKIEAEKRSQVDQY